MTWHLNGQMTTQVNIHVLPPSCHVQMTRRLQKLQIAIKTFISTCYEKHLHHMLPWKLVPLIVHLYLLPQQLLMIFCCGNVTFAWKLIIMCYYGNDPCSMTTESCSYMLSWRLVFNYCHGNLQSHIAMEMCSHIVMEMCSHILIWKCVVTYCHGNVQSHIDMECVVTYCHGNVQSHIDMECVVTYCHGNAQSLIAMET